MSIRSQARLISLSKVSGSEEAAISLSATPLRLSSFIPMTIFIKQI